MKPSIIIPALNPDQKLITLVQNLKKMDLPIVIVNDGSTEEYNIIFETLKLEFNCDICHHLNNMGKGAAIKTGIKYVASKYPDSSGYVTADADGQHAPEDIIKVVNELEKSGDSLLLGVRNFGEKNVPFKSRWGNRVTSLIFLMSTGQKSPDTQTGLRGIPKKFTELCLAVPGDRFEYEMNMLLEFAKNKIPFIDVPIATIYLENNKSSHFNPMRDSALIYVNILKYSLASLFSAAIDLFVFTIFMTLVFRTNSNGILAATMLARFTSGGVNFLVNKYIVFQSRNSQNKEMVKYITLFCFQMILSWLLVTLLSHTVFNITIIKILVDTGLFFISYQIQKNFIFNKTHPKSEQVLT